MAQVYVSRPNSTVERPVKELKAFRRVALKARKRQKVTIPLRYADLGHWDETRQTWMLEPGEITILVGGSSAELPLRQANVACNM